MQTPGYNAQLPHGLAVYPFSELLAPDSVGVQLGVCPVGSKFRYLEAAL